MVSARHSNTSNKYLFSLQQTSSLFCSRDGRISGFQLDFGKYSRTVDKDIDKDTNEDQPYSQSQKRSFWPLHNFPYGVAPPPCFYFFLSQTETLVDDDLWKILWIFHWACWTSKGHWYWEITNNAVKYLWDILPARINIVLICQATKSIPALLN